MAMSRPELEVLLVLADTVWRSCLDMLTEEQKNVLRRFLDERPTIANDLEERRKSAELGQLLQDAKNELMEENGQLRDRINWLEEHQMRELSKEKQLLNALDRYALERGWTIDMGPMCNLTVPLVGDLVKTIPLADLMAAPM
jgi:hypothetical protein